MLNPSLDKNVGTYRSGEGGRCACYVTPDLSYEEGESWSKKGEDNKWDEKKNK